MTKHTVTKEQVAANMQDVHVETIDALGKPITVVTVKMQNGFILCESSSCVDPANYDVNIGKEICLKKIEDKIWFLLGFLLQNNLYLDKKAKELGARFIDTEAIKEKYGEDVANAIQDILEPNFAESLPADAVKVGEVVETDRGEKLECIGFNEKNEPIFKIVGE